MLLIVADVIGRNFLDMPITGVAEIAARSVVAIVFLQVPAAIMQKRLTRADFLVRRIEASSPKAVALIETVFCIVGADRLCADPWAPGSKFTGGWGSSRVLRLCKVSGPFRHGRSGGSPSLAPLSRFWRRFTVRSRKSAA